GGLRGTGSSSEDRRLGRSRCGLLPDRVRRARGGGLIETKSRTQLETMDRANRVVRTILGELAERVRPGGSTGDLRQSGEKRLAELGAGPAFKGYPHPDGGPSYPAVLCTSINEEVVHGIPHAHRTLKEGDILSLDFGAVVDGLYGDAAVTVPVG